MKKLLTFALCVVSLLAGAQTSSAPQAARVEAAPAPTFTVRDVARQIKIVAYGDIRFNDPSSTARSDPSARVALVKKIADEKPNALLISGDIPYRGDRDDDWAVFDQEFKPIWDAKVRVYPALGNHELVGGAAKSLPNWWKRFPDLKERRWYSVSFGNCYFIVLDSDSDLDPESAQGKWAANELAHLPAPTDFVFLVMHHPPYTDSHEHAIPGRGHSARPQEQAFARMLEELQPKIRPRLICIAGHVHNYERFENSGVTYLVSGGGGATPYLFDRSARDKYQGGNGVNYHYLRFEIDGDTLKAKMVKLDLTDPIHPRFDEKDSFELTAKAK